MKKCNCKNPKYNSGNCGGGKVVCIICGGLILEAVSITKTGSSGTNGTGGGGVKTPNTACTGLAPAVAPESNQVSGASQ